MMIFLFAACGIPPAKDGGTDSVPGTTPTVTGNDFCAVRTIFTTKCVACHGTSLTQGELDLETDPYGAVVNVPSSTNSGALLVVPGDPAGSLLYRKMTGTQSASEEAVMPTTGILGTVYTDAVRDWIAAGASAVCDTTDTGIPTTYHPPGFSDPATHGMEAKYQVQDCLSCHGADLTGGTTGVSCDTCHQADWRTDCVYCHGGTDNSTGAPPRDIDNLTTSLSFPEHTVHTERTTHPEWDCVECHTKADDILSSGHLFIGDATHGIAELVFSAGLSSSARYATGGTCSDSYCHGNGQSGNEGSVTSGESLGCDGCHEDASGARDLSGEHHEHTGKFDCDECHGTVVSGNSTIIGPDLHVNGTRDIALPSAVTWTSSTKSCTGTCHGESHNNERWD